MLFLKSEQKKSAEEFWREYEEETGEKVLERGFGKYVSGWDEFDENNLNDIWGLVITTSGGFRFHHFPKYSLLDSMIQLTKKDKKQEKTIFIPQENIIGGQVSLKSVCRETNWWKKIFGSDVPRLCIKYMDAASESESVEKQMIFEISF
jgi:hypothetical protein